MKRQWVNSYKLIIFDEGRRAFDTRVINADMSAIFLC